jgi:hypothetical protein
VHRAEAQARADVIVQRAFRFEDPEARYGGATDVLAAIDRRDHDLSEELGTFSKNACVVQRARARADMIDRHDRVTHRGARYEAACAGYVRS